MTKPEKDYERLMAVFHGLSTELALDTSGDARRHRVELIAQAYLDGKPSPAVDLSIDRKVRQLDLDGLARAIDRLVEEISAGICDYPVRVAERPTTAAEPIDPITAAHRAHERSLEATARATAGKRAYDAALAAYNERRHKLINQGVEPALASEQARASVDDPEALWPPGSPGTLHLEGRVLGETTIKAGAPA